MEWSDLYTLRIIQTNNSPVSLSLPSLSLICAYAAVLSGQKYVAQAIVLLEVLPSLVKVVCFCDENQSRKSVHFHSEANIIIFAGKLQRIYRYYTHQIQ